MTFYELEKECKKRRVKKIILIGSVVLVALGALIALFLLNKKEVKKIKIKKEKKVIQKPKEVKSKKRSELKPIIDLNIEVNSTKEKKVEKKEVIKNTTKQKTLIASKPLPSYSTCISLAEMYFKKEDYENAIKWAKNANIQNKKDKKSWIITAKALYKLGKKEKAIKVLKIYYKFNQDKEIKRLIDEMENN